MTDEPFKRPPTNEEIQERLRRAVERATQSDDAADPFKAIQRELTDIPLPEITSDVNRIKARLPEDDPAFAASLKNLEERAAKVLDSRETARATKEKALKEDQSNALGLGIGLSIAYMFLGFPFVGVGIGWVVDHFTGSTLGLPIGGFIGILLGCILAFQALNRLNR